MEKLIARNTSHIAGRKRHSHSSAQAKPDAENILDFSPFANATEDLCDYDNNYLLDKYKKTLKRQGIKRQKFVSNIFGLLSLRQAISAQLRSNSDIDCSAENVVVFADMRSCLDFVARLLAGDVSHAILERPGNREVKSIAIYNSFHCNEIAIDEQGLIVEHLSNMDVRRALAIITPTIQDPLGVSMSLGRKEQILDWAQQTGSLIVDRTAHQSFVKNFDSTSLWQLSGGKGVIGIWEFASILKPWSQMCCAFFPEEFVVLARQLKAVIGGEVPLNEQFAMHEFIVDGDLAKTQRHRELLYLEKRRILNLACSKVFDNRIRAMSINKGSKLVFDVSSDIDLNSVIECARRVEIPASCLTVQCVDELSSKMLIDLDCISLERIPEKIEALQCVLEVYRSRGCKV